LRFADLIRLVTELARVLLTLAEFLLRTDDLTPDERALLSDARDRAALISRSADVSRETEAMF